MIFIPEETKIAFLSSLGQILGYILIAATLFIIYLLIRLIIKSIDKLIDKKEIEKKRTNIKEDEQIKLNNFLDDNNDDNVFLLNGDWGVGKTHFLRNGELEKHTKRKIAYITPKLIEKRTIKAAIKLSVQDSKIIDKGLKHSNSIIKWLFPKEDQIPASGMIALTEIGLQVWSEHLNLSKYIIVIDEFERKNKSFDIKEILNKIIEIKEEENNNSKIIISINENKLSKEDLLIFKEWKEKTIDDEDTFFSKNTWDSMITDLSKEINNKFMFKKEFNFVFKEKQNENKNIRIIKKIINNIKQKEICKDFIGKEDKFNEYLNDLYYLYTNNNNKPIILNYRFRENIKKNLKKESLLTPGLDSIIDNNKFLKLGNLIIRDEFKYIKNFDDFESSSRINQMTPEMKRKLFMEETITIDNIEQVWSSIIKTSTTFAYEYENIDFKKEGLVMDNYNFEITSKLEDLIYKVNKNESLSFFKGEHKKKTDLISFLKENPSAINLIENNEMNVFRLLSSEDIMKHFLKIANLKIIFIKTSLKTEINFNTLKNIYYELIFIESYLTKQKDNKNKLIEMRSFLINEDMEEWIFNNNQMPQINKIMIKTNQLIDIISKKYRNVNFESSLDYYIFTEETSDYGIDSNIHQMFNKNKDYQKDYINIIIDILENKDEIKIVNIYNKKYLQEEGSFYNPIPNAFMLKMQEKIKQKIKE